MKILIGVYGKLETYDFKFQVYNVSEGSFRYSER